jgi:phage gp45-like
MIKECPILINNTAVTVVKYDDVEVQFPAINKDVKTVFVDFTEGKYNIVDKKEIEKATIEKPVEEVADKKEEKKTTKDSVKTQQKKNKDA